MMKPPARSHLNWHITTGQSLLAKFFGLLISPAGPWTIRPWWPAPFESEFLSQQHKFVKRCPAEIPGILWDMFPTITNSIYIYMLYIYMLYIYMLYIYVIYICTYIYKQLIGIWHDIAISTLKHGQLQPTLHWDLRNQLWPSSEWLWLKI